MKQNFMFDIETTGLASNAAIASIGAAHFDEDSILDTFYTAVDVETCYAAGLTSTPSTVEWWTKQSQAAQDALKSGLPLYDALRDLQNWILSKCKAESVVPWGNGSDFDIVVLNNAFNALGADPPWKFWNHRCFRTVKNLFPDPHRDREGTHHNALDDAIHQAKVLQDLVRAHALII